jgi:glycosyltransferase involved in cell wall biosynthesis
VSAYSVRRKLERGERLRVLFVNDLGFQYGAGTAQLRQVQSFLLAGHDVAGLCWAQGIVEEAIPPAPVGARGAWLGMRAINEAHPERGMDAPAIVRRLVAEAATQHADLIVVGNIHAAGWPLDLLRALERLDALVVAYMHDCYFATGRCAYPETCGLYAKGCDATCPTAGEYPVLEPAQIAGAWTLRREIFSGPAGIAAACNSRWTLEIARQSWGQPRLADVLYYGLDDRVFRPIDRALARRMLGIPEDRFVVLAGAVNLGERRKGGALYRRLVEELGDGAFHVVFGADAAGLDRVMTTGLLRDYRKMPLLYSAADLFVGTSVDEAFGQTFCEAAACGLPTVAFAVGGIPEIARDGLNARLVASGDIPAMIDTIRRLHDDPAAREALGTAGRQLVESEFSLRAQAERWMDFLARACDSTSSPGAPRPAVRTPP